VSTGAEYQFGAAGLSTVSFVLGLSLSVLQLCRQSPGSHRRPLPTGSVQAQQGPRFDFVDYTWFTLFFLSWCEKKRERSQWFNEMTQIKYGSNCGLCESLNLFKVIQLNEDINKQDYWWQLK